MKTAILMSTYNGEKHIQEQIESILAQQCESEITLWVRDDGSTDATRKILESYASKGILNWYAGENLKPAKSFLDLVAHCPGYDYYAFADQDDFWYPDKLQTAIDRMAALQGPVMVFANARLVDKELSPIGRNVYNRHPHCDYYSVLCGGGILGCTIVFNQALGQLLRTYSKPNKLIMHDSYAAIICTLFDGVIIFDPEPHMDYRQHGNNVVGTQWTKWDALKNRIQRVTQPEPVSISEMAQSILDQSPTPPNDRHLQFLKKVANYRKTLGNTMSLVFSRKPKYNGKNMEITMRLAILLRNR